MRTYNDNSDLSWIPQQLKKSVDAAMAETQSPETLDQHLPRIRDVIVHLLHGLKGKQQQLRERDATQQHSPPAPAPYGRDSYRSTTSTATTDTWRREVPQAALARGASLTQSPPGGARPVYPPDRSPPPGFRLTQSDYDPRISGMPRPSVSSDRYYNQPPRAFSPTYYNRVPSPSRSSSSQGETNRPSSTSSTRYQPQQPSPVVAAAPVENTPPPPPPPPPPMTPSPSLSPMSARNKNEFDESDPGTASALAALKRQENLARRSSVRRASMFRANGSDLKRYENAPPVPAIPSREKKLEPVDEDSKKPEAEEDTSKGK